MTDSERVGKIFNCVEDIHLLMTIGHSRNSLKRRRREVEGEETEDGELEEGEDLIDMLNE